MIRLTFHYLCRKKRRKFQRPSFTIATTCLHPGAHHPSLPCMFCCHRQSGGQQPVHHHIIWRPLPLGQQSVRTPRAGRQPPTTVLTPACVIVISSGQGCLGIEDGEGVWGGSAPVELQMKVALENRRRMRMRLRWATKASLFVCLSVCLTATSPNRKATPHC